MAVIKSTTDDSVLRIILYRTKQNVLSTITLNAATATTKVYLKQDYFQYQDDEQQFWSIRFDVDADRSEILQAISKHCIVEHEPIEEKQPNVVPTKTRITIPVEIPLSAEPCASTSSTAEEQSKRTLVTRMAKMGKQLPQVTRQPIATKDSSSPEDSDTDVRKERYKPALPKWKPDVPTRIPHEMIPYSGNGMNTSSGTPILSTSTLIAYNQMSEHGINAFLSENRIQNTEVRMNLSKLETKIEKVLDKIDLINLRTSEGHAAAKKTDVEEELLQMEEKMLALKRENRQFRIQIQELNNGNGNVKDLATALDIATATNQRLQSELKDRTNELQRMTITLNDKNEELARLRSHNSDILDEHKTSVNQKQTEHDSAIQLLKAKHLENETKINQLQMDISQLTAEKSNTFKSLEMSEEKIKVLERQLKEKNIEIVQEPALDITIKEIMNSFYQKFQDQLGEENTFNAEGLLKIVRVLIKKETTAALNRSATK